MDMKLFVVTDEVRQRWKAMVEAARTTDHHLLWHFAHGTLSDGQEWLADRTSTTHQSWAGTVTPEDVALLRVNGIQP